MNGEVSFSWGSGQVLNGIKLWKIYVIVGNYLCIRKICGCKKVFFKRSFNRRQYFRKVKGKKHLEICKK